MDTPHKLPHFEFYWVSHLWANNYLNMNILGCTVYFSSQFIVNTALREVYFLCGMIMWWMNVLVKTHSCRSIHWMDMYTWWTIYCTCRYESCTSLKERKGLKDGILIEALFHECVIVGQRGSNSSNIHLSHHHTRQKLHAKLYWNINFIAYRILIFKWYLQLLLTF